MNIDKKHYIVSAILLVVFSLGLFAGASGAVYLIEKKRDERREASKGNSHRWQNREGQRGGPPRQGENGTERPQRGGRGGGMSDYLLRRMEGQIKGLSEEQKEKIKPELAQLAEEMHTIREEVAPKMEAAFQGVKGRIRQHLDAAQQAQLEEQKHIFGEPPRGGFGNRGGPPNRNRGGERPQRPERPPAE